MNKNNKKLINLALSLIIMTIVISGCQKVVNNTVVENLENGDGGEVATKTKSIEEKVKDQKRIAEEEKERKVDQIIKEKLLEVDISEWKNYQNSIYSLEMKYPGNWNVSKEKVILYGNEKYIIILNNINNVFIIQPGEKDINLNEDEISLENIKIDKYESYIAYRDMGLNSYVYRYFIKTEKDNLQLFFKRGDSYEDIELDDKVVIRKIISTIKFK